MGMFGLPDIKIPDFLDPVGNIGRGAVQAGTGLNTTDQLIIGAGAGAAGAATAPGMVGGGVTGSAAAGGAGGSMLPAIAGPLLGGAISYAGQQQTNAENRAISAEQMEFQERMSSTAHQREVADLEKAGLNPILSANAGASSPSGAGIAAQNAVQPGINTALEIAKTQMQDGMNDASKGLMGKQGELAAANTKSAEANKRSIDMSTALTAQQIPKQQAEADFYRRYGEKAVMVDKAINATQGLLGIGTSALGIGGMIKGLQKPKEIYVDPKTGEILK